MNTNSLLIAALATALASAAAPAFAHHAANQAAVQFINLMDGSTLFVFKDGKMAKADKYNRPVYLTDGEALEAKDGRKVTAVGNEVARLATLFRQDHEN